MTTSPKQNGMDNLKKLEFVTSVDLNYSKKEQSDVYHFIYASQLYGTLFAIYGRFLPDSDKSITANNFPLKSISLKLVNYKGCINIGFTGHAPEWNESKKTIDFRIRGTSTIVDKDFVFDNTINVSKGTRFSIIFNRILHPLPNFEDFLEHRNPNEDAVVTQLSEEPPIAPLFDSEFNDRDGVDFYNSDLKPGMLNPFPPLVGHRCITSNVNLFF